MQVTISGIVRPRHHHKVLILESEAHHNKDKSRE
jgi:hypothetical protein